MKVCPKHEWAYADDGACRWCEPAGWTAVEFDATPPPGTPPPTPEMIDWADREFAALVAETLWEGHGLIDASYQRVLEAQRAMRSDEAAPEFALVHDGNLSSRADYVAGLMCAATAHEDKHRDPKQDEIVRAIKRDEERAKLWDELHAMFGIKGSP